MFVLSQRLRQREIDTISRVGCSRSTVARLLAAELVLIVLMSGVVCAGLLWLVQENSSSLVRALILNHCSLIQAFNRGQWTAPAENGVNHKHER